MYKDALEHEFKTQGIPFQRERKYDIRYKNIILPHHFYADFVIMDKVILEVKSGTGIADDFLAQTLNYLAASGLKLGLIVNFGKDSLEYKRVIL